jgi:hypothetical protein
MKEKMAGGPGNAKTLKISVKFNKLFALMVRLSYHFSGHFGKSTALAKVMEQS